MESKEITITGVKGGSITYDDKKLIIKRKGLFGMALHGLKGDKTIPYKSITAIQFKKAGFQYGFIQFSIIGGREAKGGYMQSIQDENSVLFNKKNQPEFEKFKDFIENKIY